jgi:uncharacterized membrane protein
MAMELDKTNLTEGAQSVLATLKEHKEIALPAAAAALAAGATPTLIRKVTQNAEDKGEREASTLGQKLAEGAKQGLGGGGGLAGKALSKLTGGGDSGSGGGKKTRRLPIQRWTDVAVPVEKAYQAWTKFDDYPRFMHRVLNVERKDRDKVSWQEKIWFSNREWEGEITERRKNDRIAWKTTSGMSHKGIVSFHKLGDNLTRVMVDMEFEPNGMIEKMASGMRFVKRAVQADLARFKAYVEMQDARGIDYRENDDADEPTTRGRKSDGERASGRERRAAGRSQRRSSARR